MTSQNDESRKAKEVAESLYWSQSTAQKGIRAALEYMASDAKETEARTEAKYAELVEVLKYYADEDNYWNVTDGGKCFETTNADQGERARDALSRIGKAGA
jgi:hypothetical protein